MGADVIKVREEIDRAIEGRTVLELFERNASQFGDRPALRRQTERGWETITWRQYRDQAVEIAAGLRGLGVGHGDFVAIMARNVPEHVIADGGVLHAAATPVSIYNTLAPEQIAYIAKDCKAKVAILENREFAKRWAEIKDQLPALKAVVMIEDAEDFRYLGNVLSWDELIAKGRDELAKNPNLVRDAVAEVKPQDPATIVYTSGTTGPPKGVEITHRNVRWSMESVFRHLTLPMHLRVISYLPLAHVAERAVTHYAGLHRANDMYFVPELTQAVEVAKEVHPDIFLGVPRVWEKAKAAIEAKMREESSPAKKAIAAKALAVGRKAAALEGAGRPVPPLLALQRSLFDKLVFSKIRHGLGLDRVKVVLTGSAPIAPDVIEFFHAAGLKILDTWGMTELTVVASINPMDKPRIGTVGVPIPGVEIKIAADGEILARGGVVTGGYRNRPKETAETYVDGWVHSGDLGVIGADGHLRITGRKKELIITAGGKNISPNNIEDLLKAHPLVGQVCVVGDAKPYLTALVAIDGETAPAWAAEHGVPFTDIASFSRDDRVRAEIQGAVDAVNQRVAKVESIKKFVLLPTEWTPDTGELTPTLKLKRSVVHDRYADEIAGLYSG